jgi:hypothetical protein
MTGISNDQTSLDKKRNKNCRDESCHAIEESKARSSGKESRNSLSILDTIFLYPYIFFTCLVPEDYFDVTLEVLSVFYSMS